MMPEFNVEELDLPAWVAQAEPEKRNFREAVHIILTAISSSTALRSTMVMKGGMLMAIRYNSDRFTRDADFLTRARYLKDGELGLIAEIGAQIDSANELLPYDTMCRCQKSKLQPARADASFPTLTLNIGYAQRSKQTQLDKLLNGQSPTIVEIDYSYNEAVLDVEILSIGDGEELKAYSFLNLLAEKLRSLLQQPIRKRNRRQDVYDLNLLIGNSKALQADERRRLLALLVASCKERGIEAKKDSIANPAVKVMAQHGYEDLAPDVAGELPPFQDSYAVVQRFYEGLPWEQLFDVS